MPSEISRIYVGFKGFFSQ